MPNNDLTRDSYNPPGINSDDWETFKFNDLEEMELNNKKDYVALAIKISESLPSIVRQLEEGFGVTYGTKSNTGNNKGPSLMDKLHMEELDI